MCTSVPQFPWSCGKVLQCYFNDFGVASGKRLSQQSSCQVDTGIGFFEERESRDFSFSRELSLVILVVLPTPPASDPLAFSCQQHMWQLPYGGLRKVYPITVFGVLNNKFKTCSFRQTKSNLVCLDRQHGKFLTKEKCYLWPQLAPCAQAFTQPRSLSSPNWSNDVWLIAILFTEVVGPRLWFTSF